MRTYLGTVYIEAAAQVGYVDIEPSFKEGYGNRLLGLQWVLTGEDTANTAKNIILAASALQPKRTTLATADMLDGDILGVAAVPFVTDVITVGDAEKEPDAAVVMADDALFASNLRMLLLSPVAVAAGKDVTAYLRVMVEEVKLNASLRDRMINRVYE